MIDPALKHIIEPELAEGEELFWASTSGPHARDSFGAIFNFFWGVVCLLGLGLSLYKLTIETTLAIKLFFILLAFFFLRDSIRSLGSVSEKSKKLTTFFAITSKRIIVLKPNMKKIKSYGQNILEDIKRIDKDGMSDLVLSGGGGDVYIEMPNVERGQEAERLLLRYFLKQNEKTS